MHDHDGCDEAIAKAMREDRPGKAEFLAARCDLEHRDIAATETPERTTTDQAPRAHEAQEASHG